MTRSLATDPTTGTTEDQPVVAVHNNLDTALTNVTVKTADGKTTTLETTAHHPFWNATKKEWTDAANLTPGTELAALTGETALVVSIHTWTGRQHMRDLTIATTHTYYVLANQTPVLVHNCDTEDFAHGATRKSGQSIIENGLDESASLANEFKSKSPGSFYTIPVRRSQ